MCKMANEIVKVYYPDSSNNQQFAYCETRGSFNEFIENINSFVGRVDMLPLAFAEGLFGQRYRMYWVDEDNDKVLINSDYSLRIFLARTNGIKKVHIEEKDNNNQTPQSAQQNQQTPSSTAPNSAQKAPVHSGVQCDNCNIIPIVGFRYKCAQCHDYDLCENCEQKKAHPDHVMFRFPVPLPRNYDLNRRFFKKLRHGCFGRMADTTEGDEHHRSHRFGRRRHEGRNANTSCPAGPGAFNQFYTMMCDMAEGMDYEDIQNAAAASAGASAPPPPEATSARASTSNEATPQENRYDANNATGRNNETETPLLFPIDPNYARAGVEVLKGFSQVFGKLLDPLGIVVDVDIAVKGDKKKEEEKQQQPQQQQQQQAEQASQTTSENSQQREAPASGTQTPNNTDRDSPASSSASIAPISVDSNPSVSKATATDPGLEGIRVFASDASQQTTETHEENLMDVDTVVNAAGTSAIDSNERRVSSPIEATWTMIEDRFVDLNVDGQSNEVSQPTNEPATPAQNVNYSQLSKDLQSHIQAEELAKQQQEERLKHQQEQQKRAQPEPPRHPDPKINKALIAMTAMGFSNDGGWLTNLLETVNGDIPKALELLHPSR